MYAGDCMITRRGDLIDCIAPSEGFKVDVIYVTPEFIELSTPQSNYGMRGQLALFNNPIMRLNKQQQQVCALDFDYIKRRLSLDDHHFHRLYLNIVQASLTLHSVCTIVAMSRARAHPRKPHASAAPRARASNLKSNMVGI